MEFWTAQAAQAKWSYVCTHTMAAMAVFACMYQRTRLFPRLDLAATCSRLTYVTVGERVETNGQRSEAWRAPLFGTPAVVLGSLGSQLEGCISLVVLCVIQIDERARAIGESIELDDGRHASGPDTACRGKFHNFASWSQGFTSYVLCSKKACRRLRSRWLKCSRRVWERPSSLAVFRACASARRTASTAASRRSSGFWSLAAAAWQLCGALWDCRESRHVLSVDSFALC